MPETEENKTMPILTPDLMSNVKRADYLSVIKFLPVGLLIFEMFKDQTSYSLILNTY